MRQTQWTQEAVLVAKRYSNVRSDLRIRHKQETQRLTKEFAAKKRAMTTSLPPTRRKLH